MRSTQAAADHAQIDRAFLAGWAEAKTLAAPPLSGDPKVSVRRQRLKATVTLRESREKKLEAAKAPAERLIAARAEVEEAARTVITVRGSLRCSIQEGIKRQAQEAEAEEAQRQLVVNAKATVAKAQEAMTSDLPKEAARAKVPPCQRGVET